MRKEHSKSHTRKGRAVRPVWWGQHGLRRFLYYLNLVSLPTHSSTLGNKSLICEGSVICLWTQQTSPSPTRAPLCKVQYRGPCSCPSWGWWFLLLCISHSFYVEKGARMGISVTAAVAQEVMMTSWPGGWKEFLGEGFPHLVESSKAGTQFTSLVSGP